MLPVDMTLREAHDIGEALEMNIESLESVERCHVHLDWNSDHAAEHASDGTGGMGSARALKDEEEAEQTEEQDARP